MVRYIPYLSHYVPISQFYGGMSSDEAIGTPASFSYSRALDHRRNPSQLTVLPGPRQIGKGVVTDLILNMVQVANGTRYAYGDQGNIYKVDNSNNLTYINKLPAGSDGCLYRSDIDALYFATQTDIRRMYPMSGTPALDVIYGQRQSVTATRTGGASSYTVLNAIDESQLCSFQPDIEPFYSIKVNIGVVGTGNLTLTLHDGLNNVLATQTITNANLKSGLNEFVFSSQIRALVKPNARTYHFHLTSSVTNDTTTVVTATSGTLNTADFQLWAYLLVDTINNFHPMVQFLQYNCIGNGNYLAVHEPLSDSSPSLAEFQQHRLVFPAGYEVCGLAPTNEFLAIAIAKYSTDGTKDFQSGKIILWDGISQTYNQIIDVSAGAPEAIQTKENMPYFIVNGKLCVWAGGNNITQIRKVASLDNTFSGVIDNTRVYPNMMCVKDNMLHFGYPSKTTNTSIEHGVYVWGHIEKNYPESFNYGYVPSSMQSGTDNTNSSGNLQMGCVKSFGDEMYLSWKDKSGNYGLDIVDNLCTPAPVFKFRARRFDAGMMYHDKLAVRQLLITSAWPISGAVLTAVSSIDGAAYVSGQSQAANATKLISGIAQPNNFKRIVTGFDGTCDSTVTTSPIIYNHLLEYKPQETKFVP